MKIQKGMIFLGLAVFAIGMAACGGGETGGKFSDAKSVLQKFNQNMEDWLEDMDKADSAQKVAAALNAFTSKMKDLRDEMKKIEEKYPELKGMSDPPEELKEEAKKMEELMTKMMSAMMKVSEYADDPEVQKAQKALDEVMK